MNWGKGLTIFIITFMIFILAMVYQTFQVDVPLISEDYYQQEVDYQQKIDGQNRLNKKGQISLIQKNGEIKISFPFTSNLIQGTIHWICFSDLEKDFDTKIDCNEIGEMFLPVKTGMTGLHQVQISCDYQGKSYYQQSELELK